MPQPHEQPLRFTHLSQSPRCDMKILFRSSTPFRCWLSHFRCDETLPLQTLKCSINTTDRNVTASAPLKLLADGNAIGIIAKSDEHQHHHQFKVAKLVTLEHFL